MTDPRQSENVKWLYWMAVGLPALALALYPLVELLGRVIQDFPGMSASAFAVAVTIVIVKLRAHRKQAHRAAILSNLERLAAGRKEGDPLERELAEAAYAGLSDPKLKLLKPELEVEAERSLSYLDAPARGVVTSGAATLILALAGAVVFWSESRGVALALAGVGLLSGADALVTHLRLTLHYYGGCAVEAIEVASFWRVEEGGRGPGDGTPGDEEFTAREHAPEKVRVRVGKGVVA